MYAHFRLVIIGLGLGLILAGCPKKGNGRGTGPGPRRAAPPTPPRYVVKTLALRRGSALAPGSPAAVIGIMRRELARTQARLKDPKGDKPYFIAYTTTAMRRVDIRAKLGGIVSSLDGEGRRLTVDLRVGSHKFDNAHFIGRSFGAYGGRLPLTDDEAAIRNAIWLATDRVYRAASSELSRARARAKTTTKAEDPADDFSKEPKVRIIGKPIRLSLDRKVWEARMRAVSSVFRAYPELISSRADFGAVGVTRYTVTSEGTVLQIPESRTRVTLMARAMATDGMTFVRQESFYAPTVEGLPAVAALKETAKRLVRELQALKKAPLAHPYEGPAIFRGRAAAVFFHEVFGHRMEGHRQKLSRFDQTFTKKRGTQVMPRFLSVFDDPGLLAINGTFLNGYYYVDDEGVRGRRVDMVKGGVLHDFLMSRIPVHTHPRSNGHGRRSPGMRAVARQANLVVDAAKVVSYQTLRRLLLDEVKRQGKPYGLIFDDVTGGFTFTTRALPQAFKVHPVMVYRVYPDGRPDELVRGVDLVGTPLLALTRIVAAANDFQTFNGMCGAESGWVPVSATAPSLLFSKIETQRKPTRKEKGPILPPPRIPSRGDGR